MPIHLIYEQVPEVSNGAIGREEKQNSQILSPSSSWKKQPGQALGLAAGQNEELSHQLRSEESHGRSLSDFTRPGASLATGHLNLHGSSNWR